MSIGANSASYLQSIEYQVKMGCDMLARNPDFAGKEVNIVAQSQGNIVARGILQQCDAVKVVNYISCAGPQMGTDIIPSCTDSLWCM